MRPWVSQWQEKTLPVQMLAKILTVNLKGIRVLGISKLCSLLNSFTLPLRSVFHVSLWFRNSSSCSLFLHQIFFEVCWLPRILFFPLFLFLGKKGFSSSKTSFLALAFMSQSGHELKRALPFAAVRRRIEVLEWSLWRKESINLDLTELFMYLWGFKMDY